MYLDCELSSMLGDQRERSVFTTDYQDGSDGGGSLDIKSLAVGKTRVIYPLFFSSSFDNNDYHYYYINVHICKGPKR